MQIPFFPNYIIKIKLLPNPLADETYPFDKALGCKRAILYMWSVTFASINRWLVLSRHSLHLKHVAFLLTLESVVSEACKFRSVDANNSYQMTHPYIIGKYVIKRFSRVKLLDHVFCLFHSMSPWQSKCHILMLNLHNETKIEVLPRHLTQMTWILFVGQTRNFVADHFG